MCTDLVYLSARVPREDRDTLAALLALRGQSVQDFLRQVVAAELRHFRGHLAERLAQPREDP